MTKQMSMIKDLEWQTQGQLIVSVTPIWNYTIGQVGEGVILMISRNMVAEVTEQSHHETFAAVKAANKHWQETLAPYLKGQNK